MANVSLFGSGTHPLADPEFDLGGRKRNLSDPVRVRLRHLDGETTVRTIGMLFLIGAFLTLLNTAVILGSDRSFDQIVKAFNPLNVKPETQRTLTLGFAVLSFLVMQLFGYWLRRLSNSVRWTVVVLSVAGVLLSLLNIFGDLRSGEITLDTFQSLIEIAPSAMFVLFLASSRNSTIFNRDYRSVIAQTPEIQSQFGRRDILFLGVYLIVLLAGFLVMWINVLEGA